MVIRFVKSISAILSLEASKPTMRKPYSSSKALCLADFSSCAAKSTSSGIPLLWRNLEFMLRIHLLIPARALRVIFTGSFKSEATPSRNVIRCPSYTSRHVAVNIGAAVFRASSDKSIFTVSSLLTLA